MISNPIEGYEINNVGCTSVYAFTPYEKGKNIPREWNFIIVANNVDAARVLYIQGFKFLISTSKNKLDNLSAVDIVFHHDIHYEIKIARAEECIAILEKYPEAVYKAPSQVYKVPWASNDVL